MDILACTDNNYVMPCGVMICSLCENNREEHIRFHLIVDNEVTEANKQLLQTTVDAYGNDIAFYDMSGKDRARFTIGGGQPRTFSPDCLYLLSVAGRRHSPL